MGKKVYFKKSLLELLCALFVLGVLVVYFIQLLRIPEASRGYPQGLMICAAILDLLIIAQSVRRYRSEEATVELPAFLQGLLPTLRYMAVILLYICLIPRLGFVIATLGAMFLLLWMLRVRSPFTLILFPVAFTFFLYFLFTKVLLVLLPAGSWIKALL